MVNKPRFKVSVAEYAGYCYGVERALKLAAEAAGSSAKPIVTLGPIIHNPQVVKDFVRDGVVPVDGIDDIDSGTVIIRTHGVGPEIISGAEERGLNVIDATCPFVAKAQKRAAELVADGYQLIVVGERNHPEVVGILAHAGGDALVVEEAANLKGKNLGRKLGIVVQTTQSVVNLRSVIGSLIEHSDEIKVFNTICHATIQRQEAAEKLSSQVDLMIVVGGKNSANTNRLAQICRRAGALTYHLETAAEIDEDWFNAVEAVGVTAGASTPESLLNEVVAALKVLAGSEGRRS